MLTVFFFHKIGKPMTAIFQYVTALLLTRIFYFYNSISPLRIPIYTMK